MLAFNKDAISERTDEQLEKVQQEIVDIIKKIEGATEFPRKQTALCNYCVYKSVCPSFKHEAELEKIRDVKKFKDDEGVKFVDDFGEIKKQLSELKKKEDELKTKLIQFAKQKGIDIIYGSNMKCSVKEFEKIIMPEDREKFIELIKEKGLWDELSMVCYPKLNSKVIKGEIDEDVKKEIEVMKDFRLSLRGGW